MKRFITLLWIAVAVFMLSGCSNTKQEMELTYRDQGIKMCIRDSPLHREKDRLGAL